MVVIPHFTCQSKGEQMDLKQLPSDPLGFLQWVAAAAIALLVFIPKFLREHKSESGMIDRLMRELASERSKRTEAEARADMFAEERNRLILEFSDMKTNSALVIEKLNHLTQQNALLTEQSAHLTEQNGMLTRKVEELTQALERLSNAS